MPAAIRRTTVTPAEGGNVVHVHISDAPLEEPFGSIELQMTVALPEYEGPLLLAQAQREAMQAAQDVLSHHLKALAGEIQSLTQLHPVVKIERP